MGAQIVGGVSIRSRNGDPSLNGYIRSRQWPNHYVRQAKNEYAHTPSTIIGIRLRPCMISSTSLLSSTPPPIPYCSSSHSTQDNTPLEMNFRSYFLQKMPEGGRKQRKWPLREDLVAVSSQTRRSAFALPRGCRDITSFENRPRGRVILSRVFYGSCT